MNYAKLWENQLTMHPFLNIYCGIAVCWTKHRECPKTLHLQLSIYCSHQPGAWRVHNEDVFIVNPSIKTGVFMYDYDQLHMPIAPSVYIYIIFVIYNNKINNIVKYNELYVY